MSITGGKLLKTHILYIKKQYAKQWPKDNYNKQYKKKQEKQKEQKIQKQKLQICYDTANKLAYEIKQSEEYINYKNLKKEVNENLELKEKLDNFEKLRYEVQITAIQGLQKEEQKVIDMQNLYAELIQDETMKKYFDAELKFNVLLTDVNKIIAEAVQDLVKQRKIWSIF